MKQIQWKMSSKIGPLYLVASEKGLQGIFWKEKKIPFTKDLKSTKPEIKFLAKTVKEITEYLNGDRVDFDIPLDIVGTDFQKRVWSELVKIPYGQTCSYKDIAIKLRDANASRAVGTANGKNPLSLIVPCHRVITSSGTLGGYAGGLDIKTKLLELEKKLLSH